MRLAVEFTRNCRNTLSLSSQSFWSGLTHLRIWSETLFETVAPFTNQIRMANSVDSHPHYEPSFQDLHCLKKHCFGLLVTHSLNKNKKKKSKLNKIQYNLNGSNPDGSLTVDDSNSFFSPYKILPIAQENNFFSYFIIELYVVCTH